MNTTGNYNVIGRGKASGKKIVILTQVTEEEAERTCEMWGWVFDDGYNSFWMEIEEIKMNKERATEILYGIGEMIAKELGCTYTDEVDGDYGVWDELGKKAFGEYKEIILHDGSGRRKGKSVELTYRFGNPKICVFGRDESGKETLASLELNDGGYDDDGKYIHTGNYKFAESQVWGREGAKMFNRLLNIWIERGGE